MKTKDLLIHDALFAKKAFEDYLKDSNYELVGHAQNSSSAAELTEKLHPEVVILDYTINDRMGTFDCFETLSHLKSVDSNIKSIGILLLLFDLLKQSLKVFDGRLSRPYNKEIVPGELSKVI